MPRIPIVIYTFVANVSVFIFSYSWVSMCHVILTLKFKFNLDRFDIGKKNYIHRKG